MICYACGNKMRKKVGDYHYVESGLPNVTLLGITIFHCACGEEMPVIPCPDKLQTKLAQAIAAKPKPLSGAEIRFLRKFLVLKANEFAELLGVSKVTVSRWENGKVKIDKSYDALVRAVATNQDFRAFLAKRSKSRAKGGPGKTNYILDARELAACSA